MHRWRRKWQRNSLEAGRNGQGSLLRQPDFTSILDGIDQSSINQALANEYASHIAANEQQVEQALEFKARLYESLITGTISKEEYTDYKAKYTRIAENAKESIRVLKEKLADVLENRSERNRWISHFTQFSTMETLDRKPGDYCGTDLH